MIDTPVPVLANDVITLLGAGSEGVNLTWSHHRNGPLVIDVPDHLLDKVRLLYYISLLCLGRVSHASLCSPFITID